MVTSDAYLQELLRRYQANFDVTENYKFGEILFPAYAFFHSMSEKYVLRKEAQLWAVKTFEHVFFIKETSFSPKKIDEIKELIIQKIEPEFVRKNEKYPEKDHMISYITFVVLCDSVPDSQTKKMIKKFHFDKGYLLNFRGHSEAKLVVATMDTKEVFTNYVGKELKSLLFDIYKKMEELL